MFDGIEDNRILLAGFDKYDTSSCPPSDSVPFLWMANHYAVSASKYDHGYIKPRFSPPEQHWPIMKVVWYPAMEIQGRNEN